MAKQFIFYDTETTGTNVDKDRIIEIAAYYPFKDKSFSSYVKPDIPVPTQATAIHGISDEMLTDAPSFKTVFHQLKEFCGDEVILVAHNNDNFDAPLFARECQRHSIPELEFPTLDSLKWARKYRTDLPRHNLQYLRQLYGINVNQAHRALDDVIVLHQLFSIMIGDLDAETVLRLMSEEECPLTMTFGKYKGKSLEEIPDSYFKWLREQGALDKPENEKLRKAIDKCKSC
ncbi:MAG: DUF3820 family protein [Victivallaceae bacterium]